METTSVPHSSPDSKERAPGKLPISYGQLPAGCSESNSKLDSAPNGDATIFSRCFFSKKRSGARRAGTRRRRGKNLMTSQTGLFFLACRLHTSLPCHTECGFSLAFRQAFPADHRTAGTQSDSELLLARLRHTSRRVPARVFCARPRRLSQMTRALLISPISSGE